MIIHYAHYKLIINILLKQKTDIVQTQTEIVQKQQKCTGFMQLYLFT